MPYSLNPNDPNLPRAILATDRLTRGLALIDEAMSLIGQVAYGDYDIPFAEELAVAKEADQVTMAADALRQLMDRRSEYRHNFAQLAEARERGRRAVA